MNFGRVAQVSFTGVDIKPITDLRIVFNVEKHDGISFNSANISVFNLSATARKTLARPYPIGFPMIEPVITVFLKAGYEGKDVQMFVGQLVSATNVRIGPDWRTDMFLFSGFFSATIARSVISLADKTPARTIIDRLLEPLKIDVIYTDSASDTIKNEKVSDYSTSALSYQAVSDFLDRYGLSFTIEEDGQGLIYKSEEPRDPDSGQTLDNTFSPNTGLLGTPKIMMTGVSIRSLLRPRVRLFQKIFVESETITGTLRGGSDLPVSEYHVINVSHSGDNRGEDWFTSIEASYSKLIDGEYGDSV